MGVIFVCVVRDLRNWTVGKSLKCVTVCEVLWISVIEYCCVAPGVDGGA